MEANLQEQLSGHLHFTKQKVGQGHVVQFGNDAIRWKISKSAIFFTFLIFAKTCGNESNTETDMHRETDKANGYRRNRRFSKTKNKKN